MRDYDGVATKTATSLQQAKRAEVGLKQAPAQTAVQLAGAAGELLRLQRQYGNRYVQRILNLSRQAEDEATVGPKMGGPNQVARKGQQLLDSSISAQMKPTLGASHGGARVHVDGQATHLKKGERSDTDSTRSFTQHEQIRVEQQITGHRKPVQRWGSADHEKISTDGAQGIIEDSLFVYQVANSSSLMDFTTKRLLWTGPLFLTGITKGEGPDHGEDGNYSHTNVAAATAQNLQVQNSHLNRAAEYRQQAKALEKQGRPVHERGSLYNKMFRELGDACHIAQDRGSHGEGVKSKGHNDPRTKSGWDPDSPTDNAAGYRDAVNNTKQLYRAWKALASSAE